MIYAFLGSLFCMSAVILDAASSHLLQSSAPKSLDWMDTAIRYQFIHGLALILNGIILKIIPKSAQRLPLYSGGFFIAGIFFFCGSLYMLAFGVSLPIPMMTPAGGIFFITAWGTLAVSFRKIGKLN